MIGDYVFTQKPIYLFCCSVVKKRNNIYITATPIGLLSAREYYVLFHSLLFTMGFFNYVVVSYKKKKEIYIYIICSQYNCDIHNEKKQYLMIKVRGRGKTNIYAVLITIYTCISLFKNCSSTVGKTSHIIRSYPGVDMWAPVVLQEYGRLRVYLFRLLYHLLPS